MAEDNDLSLIIEECKNGSERAFEELFDLYSGRCYSFFMRLCGDHHTSEDLLSELFVKLVNKIGTFRGGKFESWLFRIASNIFYDHLRKKQRTQKLLDESIENQERKQPRHLVSDEIIEENLQTALEKLDVETRELILKRYFGEMSFKELSSLNNEPIGTTLAKVHRGLKQLRSLMER